MSVVGPLERKPVRVLRRSEPDHPLIFERCSQVRNDTESTFPWAGLVGSDSQPKSRWRRETLRIPRGSLCLGAYFQAHEILNSPTPAEGSSRMSVPSANALWSPGRLRETAPMLGRRGLPDSAVAAS